MPINRRDYACALFIVLAGGASSAEPVMSADTASDGWRFQFTPYAFLPTHTQGTSTIDGVSGDIVLDLGDVFDLLEGAGSLQFEAWNGRWGILADAYYAYLTLDESLDLPGPTGGSIDISTLTRQSWLSLMAAYRFAEGTTTAGRPYVLDASAGLRWNSLEQTAKIDVNVPVGAGLSRGDELGGTETWWEPTFGLRGAVEVADAWTLGASAEVGGFGVNGSEFQYLVRVGADWQAWENTSLKFGWQFYGIDFSTGDGDDEFAYDVDQNGLYLAATFRF